MTNNYTRTIKDKVSCFLERNELSSKKILLAVSGGADSVCLLYMLRSLSEKFDLELSVCHVNHMIRKEAQSDLEFVKVIASKLSLPFYSHTFDVQLFAKEKGMGLEEAARVIRYDYFTHLKNELSYDLIATAHNCNDNAETLLFHLVRGSGILGLCGISENQNGIIRPLLTCTREEIEGMILENGLSFVTDCTNFDTDYSRNYIRHEILPRLSKLNPDYLHSFAKTADIAKEYADYIKKETDAQITDNICDLLKLDKLLQSEIIRKLYFDFANLYPSYDSTQRILDFIKADNISGKKLQLENNITCIFSGGKIVFTKTDKENSSSFNIILKEGKNIINERFAAVLCPNDAFDESFTDFYNGEEIIYKLYKKVYILSDKINGMLKARNRKAGDTITYGSCTRKIKELFINAKIPLLERDTIPIIYDDEKIIYVPDFPICDDCKCVDKHGATVLAIFKASKRSEFLEKQK